MGERKDRLAGEKRGSREDQLVGSRIGGVRLEKLLGRGAMGAVFLGVQESLERRVAVKVLSSAPLNEEASAERFFKEARAAARVNHPNVVQVYDAGIANDIPYILMELVEGEGLGRRIKRLGKVPPLEAVDIIIGATRGLAAAHDRSLIHRDIKPDNILIAHDGTPKLADFGLTKDLSAETGEMTMAGHLLGTPNYMSPEACSGSPLDARSDLYSLGVTLFLAVTGKLPFKATSLHGLLLEHLTKKPPAPRSIEPGVPKRLDALILRLLEKEPSARISTAHRLLEELIFLRDDCSESGSAPPLPDWDVGKAPPLPAPPAPAPAPAPARVPPVERAEASATGAAPPEALEAAARAVPRPPPRPAPGQPGFADDMTGTAVMPPEVLGAVLAAEVAGRPPAPSGGGAEAAVVPAPSVAPPDAPAARAEPGSKVADGLESLSILGPEALAEIERMRENVGSLGFSSSAVAPPPPAPEAGAAAAPAAPVTRRRLSPHLKPPLLAARPPVRGMGMAAALPAPGPPASQPEPPPGQPKHKVTDPFADSIAFAEAGPSRPPAPAAPPGPAPSGAPGPVRGPSPTAEPSPLERADTQRYERPATRAGEGRPGPAAVAADASGADVTDIVPELAYQRPGVQLPAGPPAAPPAGPGPAGASGGGAAPASAAPPSALGAQPAVSRWLKPPLAAPADARARSPDHRGIPELGPPKGEPVFVLETSRRREPGRHTAGTPSGPAPSGPAYPASEAEAAGGAPPPAAETSGSVAVFQPLREGEAVAAGVGLEELLLRGKLHYSRDKFQAAEQDFARAIELSPRHAVAHFALACVLARQCKDALALDYLDRSIALGFRDRDKIVNSRDFARLVSHSRFRSVLAKLR